MKFLLQALALTLALSPAVLAQENNAERAVIEIVQILHRDPGPIRDMVRSALDPRGSIGQIDDKLIIATTASNFAQIQARIVDTDVPPRRLVIGVDFSYQRGPDDARTLQPDTQQPDSRQQSQAIEGESLIFLANAVGPDNNAAPADAADAEPDTDMDRSNSPRITITAEVMNDVATVNLSPENIPGFSGSHIVRIPLGVWQRVTAPMTDPDVDTASDGDTTAVAEPATAAVAVRVDRVP